MSDDYPVPESLRRWHELCDKYKVVEDKAFTENRLSTPEARRELDEICDQIEIAWAEAPRLDRFRVDWRAIRQIWRDRFRWRSA